MAAQAATQAVVIAAARLAGRSLRSARSVREPRCGDHHRLRGRPGRHRSLLTR